MNLNCNQSKNLKHCMNKINSDDFDHIPPFVATLFEMLNDKSISDIINWSKDGMSFKVYDIEIF